MDRWMEQGIAEAPTHVLFSQKLFSVMSCPNRDEQGPRRTLRSVGVKIGKNERLIWGKGKVPLPLRIPC